MHQTHRVAAVLALVSTVLTATCPLSLRAQEVVIIPLDYGWAEGEVVFESQGHFESGAFPVESNDWIASSPDGLYAPPAASSDSVQVLADVVTSYGEPIVGEIIRVEVVGETLEGGSPQTSPSQPAEVFSGEPVPLTKGHANTVTPGDARAGLPSPKTGGAETSQNAKSSDSLSKSSSNPSASEESSPKNEPAKKIAYTHQEVVEALSVDLDRAVKQLMAIHAKPSPYTEKLNKIEKQLEEINELSRKRTKALRLLNQKATKHEKKLDENRASISDLKKSVEKNSSDLRDLATKVDEVATATEQVASNAGSETAIAGLKAEIHEAGKTFAESLTRIEESLAAQSKASRTKDSAGKGAVEGLQSKIHEAGKSVRESLARIEKSLATKADGGTKAIDAKAAAGIQAIGALQQKFQNQDQSLKRLVEAVRKSRQNDSVARKVDETAKKVDAANQQQQNALQQLSDAVAKLHESLTQQSKQLEATGKQIAQLMTGSSTNAATTGQDEAIKRISAQLEEQRAEIKQVIQQLDEWNNSTASRSASDLSKDDDASETATDETATEGEKAAGEGDAASKKTPAGNSVVIQAQEERLKEVIQRVKDATE